MSEIAQSVKKADSQLPAINHKDQNGSINNDLSRSDDEGNVLPLTHNNKRKKHRKKFRKHSPQYYEQKRIEKFNKKLEEKWDSHFINDHIPDLYAKKKQSKPGKTLSKLNSDKRSITPLNPKAAGNTTGNFIVKKDSLPLPKIQKPSKRSNSFNVHVVPQKPTILTQKAQKVPQKPKQKQQLKQPSQTKQVKQQLQQTPKQAQVKQSLKPPSEQKKKRQGTSQQSRRHVDLQKIKQKPYFEDYKKALNDLHEEVKFNNCHKQALEFFLQAIEKKSVRDLLDKEFNLIKKKQSLVFRVNNAIANRQKMLEKVKQSGIKLIKDDKQILELIDHYRTSTLAVVQEILKWKQTWHALYYEVFKKSKNFDFVYQTQNYLLTLMSSTDGILQHIIKQKKQTKPQKAEQKQQVIEQLSPKKQEKTQQKPNTSKEIESKPINETNAKPQTAVNLNGQNTKTAQKQVIVSSTKIESSKKDIPQQSPIKQLNSSSKQVQKPTIKTQAQKQPFIAAQNDPFLISLHSIGKEDKNIILKIRACELLLIEESFNFIKK